MPQDQPRKSPALRSSIHKLCENKTDTFSSCGSNEVDSGATTNKLVSISRLLNPVEVPPLQAGRSESRDTPSQAMAPLKSLKRVVRSATPDDLGASETGNTSAKSPDIESLIPAIIVGSGETSQISSNSTNQRRPGSAQPTQLQNVTPKTRRGLLSNPASGSVSRHKRRKSNEGSIPIENSQLPPGTSEGNRTSFGDDPPFYHASNFVHKKNNTIAKQQWEAMVASLADEDTIRMYDLKGGSLPKDIAETISILPELPLTNKDVYSGFASIPRMDKLILGAYLTGLRQVVDANLEAQWNQREGGVGKAVEASAHRESPKSLTKSFIQPFLPAYVTNENTIDEAVFEAPISERLAAFKRYRLPGCGRRRTGDLETFQRNYSKATSNEKRKGKTTSKVLPTEYPEHEENTHEDDEAAEIVRLPSQSKERYNKLVATLKASLQKEYKWENVESVVRSTLIQVGFPNEEGQTLNWKGAHAIADAEDKTRKWVKNFKSRLKDAQKLSQRNTNDV
ncbi:hypothetical protein K491DRAFT_717859 [Lophiostoma macrostomum CBS 122681]|uniref:Uncharacterized protein n=1 Tax=Lophiostoma macrostomum CBS 122681 TaxID=1314788 RepID=A0A6A6T3G4_9PLEO|nr:hypothetical protein K491DRAFT_717859 [Lophiostoma macrostomum CBS 122681]